MSDSSSSTRDDQLDISQIDRIDSLVDTTPPVEVAILDGRSGPVASNLTPVDRQISSGYGPRDRDDREAGQSDNGAPVEVGTGDA